jgi:CRP-like cAMP-binding protein
VRVLAEDGSEVGRLGAGDYFGEFSLLLGTDHSHDVDAVEDSELMVVPKERFDALLEGNPGLAASIRDRAEERRAANVGATRG